MSNNVEKFYAAMDVLRLGDSVEPKLRDVATNVVFNYLYQPTTSDEAVKEEK